MSQNIDRSFWKRHVSSPMSRIGQAVLGGRAACASEGPSAPSTHRIPAYRAHLLIPLGDLEAREHETGRAEQPYDGEEEVGEEEVVAHSGTHAAHDARALLASADAARCLFAGPRHTAPRADGPLAALV